MRLKCKRKLKMKWRLKDLGDLRNLIYCRVQGSSYVEACRTWMTRKETFLRCEPETGPCQCVKLAALAGFALKVQGPK